MPVSMSLIMSCAPLIRLHPDERYFPMDPMQFVKAARFRHHKTLVADQGYNKATKRWVTGNSHASAYYNVPVAFVNRYKPWSNGKNRRPRDSNNGSKWNVFLETRGKHAGVRSPNEVVPVYYYVTAQGHIQYWWFHGYNDGPGPLGVDNHQGDWEHVTCKINDGRLVSVYFAQHATLRHIPVSRLEMKLSRFIVYSARGSHGSYEKAGRFNLLLGVKDETRRGGYEWNSSLNLQPLKVQPWRDFAGAWGAVGEFGHTTGPLGPWHKRKNL